ncbi:TetR family transcriptional regulator [Actinorugispora endophytica]|uniref:TetR family transcriptional regulator n=1 Tax=Actinorugispora endophytica TaxID=1605990 RepID=A0A4R6UXR5_9ACTN|nr:TetR family transcriptional regulator [Actinorugispora endophytica]
MSLRERTRRAVRGEIAEAAMGLFLEKGFDSTTVEEIAQAAGISRRSYFRYFTGKDEALAGALEAIGRAIAEELAQRPAGEAPWACLRHAFAPLLARAEADPRAAALARLMLERPDLQRGKEASWQEGIAQALAHRLPQGTTEPAFVSRALAGAAICCLHSAQDQWLRPGEDRPLSALLDTAMDAVHPLRPGERRAKPAE